MSFPTVYYITQVIPSCYSAGYAMCVCVSFGACVYRSLDCTRLTYRGVCVCVCVVYEDVCVGMRMCVWWGGLCWCVCERIHKGQ